MPTSMDTLKERLARYRQIKISVVGRKSGRRISIPVWFVLEGEKLHLLPVRVSDSQWYKNVLGNTSMRIAARGVEAEFPSCSCHKCKDREVRDREISGEVRGRRREEILFEV